MKRWLIIAAVCIAGFIVALAASVAFGWALGAGLSEGFSESLEAFVNSDAQEAEHHTSADGGGPGLLGDVPNWLQFLAAAFMTVFSYYLWQLGKVQAALLKAANKTGAQNTRAYISSERAWVDVSGMRMDRLEPPPPNEKNENGLAIAFVFENMGRSPAIVTERGFFVSVQELDVLPPMPPPDPEHLIIRDRFAIPQQKKWGFEEERHLPPLFVYDKRVLDALNDVYAGKKHLYVQGHIVYDSVSGIPYINIYCYRYDHTRDGFGPIPDRGHNYHGPLNEQDV